MARPVLTIAIFNEASGWSLPGALVDVIERAAGDDAQVRSVGTRAALIDALPETDLLAGLPLAEEVLAQHAPRLRWLQLTSSLGDEDPPLIAALRSGVRVISAAAMRAPQTAEHAIALLLGLARRLDIAVGAEGDQVWSTTEIARSVRTLRGGVIGVIGGGSIVREIVVRASAFGMKSLSCDPHGGSDDAADERFDPGDLSDMLERCDALVVACPRTPATRGLIGKDELSRLKTGALFVDVSRGGIVLGNAVIEAMRRGKLGGAGLDVFEKEPLPPNSVLWSMSGVIVTPHVASATPAYWEHAAEVIGANLRAILEDRDPPDEVRLEWFKSLAEARGRR